MSCTEVPATPIPSRNYFAKKHRKRPNNPNTQACRKLHREARAHTRKLRLVSNGWSMSAFPPKADKCAGKPGSSAKCHIADIPEVVTGKTNCRPSYLSTRSLSPVAVMSMVIVSMTIIMPMPAVPIVMIMIVICLNNIVGVVGDRGRNRRNGCGRGRSANGRRSNYDRNRKYHSFHFVLLKANQVHPSG